MKHREEGRKKKLSMVGTMPMHYVIILSFFFFSFLFLWECIYQVVVAFHTNIFGSVRFSSVQFICQTYDKSVEESNLVVLFSTIFVSPLFKKTQKNKNVSKKEFIMGTDSWVHKTVIYNIRIDSATTRHHEQVIHGMLCIQMMLSLHIKE